MGSILPGVLPAQNPQTAEIAQPAGNRKAADLRESALPAGRPGGMIAAVGTPSSQTGRHPSGIDHPAAAIAEALGLAHRRTKRTRRGGPTCHDCFFHRNLLCALDLEGPCTTFRPASPAGLAPPLQPSLLPRKQDEALADAA
jgi:hypothetical protein